MIEETSYTKLFLASEEILRITRATFDLWSEFIIDEHNSLNSDRIISKRGGMCKYYFHSVYILIVW